MWVPPRGEYSQQQVIPTGPACLQPAARPPPPLLPPTGPRALLLASPDVYIRPEPPIPIAPRALEAPPRDPAGYDHRAGGYEGREPYYAGPGDRYPPPRREQQHDYPPYGPPHGGFAAAPNYERYPPPPRDPYYNGYPPQRPPPPPPDPSRPLVILCRPLNLKLFLLEKPLYTSLELRWVPSLSTLADDIRAASLQHPTITGHRRRIFLSAVQVPDEHIRGIRHEVMEMEWKEMYSVVELKRELERLDEAWKAVTGKQREEVKVDDLERLRLVLTGGGNSPAVGMSPSGSEGGSNKRMRGDEEGQVEAQRLRVEQQQRSALRSICDLPPRELDLVSAAISPPGPIIGTQDAQGLWTINSHSISDGLVPELQVLMARALRDASYPPHLRIYESPTATQALQSHVPWFITLIEQTKSRFDALSKPSDPRTAHRSV